jgi:hypothetical protein
VRACARWRSCSPPEPVINGHAGPIANPEKPGGPEDDRFSPSVLLMLKMRRPILIAPVNRVWSDVCNGSNNRLGSPSELRPLILGGLNRSTQHFILKERWSVV